VCSSDLNPTLAESTSKVVESAAGTLGLKLNVLHAGTEADFEPTFSTLGQLGVRGLVIAIDSFFTARRLQLARLAKRRGVAAVYQYRDFAEAGGMMAYGGNFEGYRVAGLYTGRILKGQLPAELPFQQITKTELVVNLKTAKTLGLTVPPSLLARADEVIE